MPHKIKFEEYEEYVSNYPEPLDTLTWKELIYGFEFIDNTLHPLILYTIQKSQLAEVFLCIM